MAFETEFSIVCDICKTRSEIFDGALFTRAMVRFELRALGWIRRTGRGRLTEQGDECPRCSGLKPKETF